MKKHAAGDNMVFNNAILYAFPLYDEPFVLCKLLQAILLFSITRICHKVLRICLWGNCIIPVTHPHTLFCVAVSPFRYITHPKDNPNRRRLTCCGCFTDLHAIRILCVSLAPAECTRSTNLGESNAEEVGAGDLLVSFITVVHVVVTSVYCMYNTWARITLTRPPPLAVLAA